MTSLPFYYDVTMTSLPLYYDVTNSCYNDDTNPSNYGVTNPLVTPLYYDVTNSSIMSPIPP